MRVASARESWHTPWGNGPCSAQFDLCGSASCAICLCLRLQYEVPPHVGLVPSTTWGTALYGAPFGLCDSASAALKIACASHCWGGHVQHAGSKLVSKLHNEVEDFQVFRITLVILSQSLHPQGPFSSCQVST